MPIDGSLTTKALNIKPLFAHERNYKLKPYLLLGK